MEAGVGRGAKRRAALHQLHAGKCSTFIFPPHLFLSLSLFLCLLPLASAKTHALRTAHTEAYTYKHTHTHLHATSQSPAFVPRFSELSKIFSPFSLSLSFSRSLSLNLTLIHSLILSLLSQSLSFSLLLTSPAGPHPTPSLHMPHFHF